MNIVDLFVGEAIFHENAAKRVGQQMITDWEKPFFSRFRQPSHIHTHTKKRPTPKRPHLGNPCVVLRCPFIKETHIPRTDGHCCWLLSREERKISYSAIAFRVARFPRRRRRRFPLGISPSPRAQTCNRANFDQSSLGTSKHRD